ncbi:dephospho-CoA kinase [Candidatus Pelagibacter sp.]|nr:dephospho-CoA kinase [Candidatus Pelagibacter sp.]
MIRLALLGDIGSGKTYISELFGYPVFNADLEVTKIYKSNKSCFKKIKKILPNYFSTFPVKKNEIMKVALEENNNFKKIIKIIHPEVRKKMNIFLKRNKNKKIVVLDIPLLLENKLNKKNDYLIFVHSKKSEINKRIKKRKNFNFKLLKKLKRMQLPLEYKKRKSHFIIKNKFTKSGVKKDIKEIINFFL